MVSEKICKRCSSSFGCNSTEIEKCFCFSLKIHSDTIDFLKNTAYDCLCSSCLLELDSLVKKSYDYEFPQAGDKFKEGVHYYLENGNWVFTEFYHLLRGKCCGNSCRHCAYGFSVLEK